MGGLVVWLLVWVLVRWMTCLLGRRFVSRWECGLECTLVDLHITTHTLLMRF